MAKKQVKINRAPVLTLWAAVVAERLGHDHESALTLGKALAGLNAQSKGRRLGIFSESDEKTEKGETRQRETQKQVMVPVLGRQVPAVRMAGGVRATTKDDPIDPKSVQRYLEGKFGEDLEEVRTVMETLAKAYSPEKLEHEAYELYEQFRPQVPEGEKGWGAKGVLDLERIRSLAK